MATAACVLAASTATAQPAMTEPMPEGEEVSDIQQVGGTLTAFMFGFGLGHAVEGRWRSEGRMYALIDGLAMTGFVGATVAGIGCDRNCVYLEGAFIASMLVLTASRIVQTYDASWGARKHNDRLYAQRKRAGRRYSVTPLLAPTSAADGLVAGAALRF